MPNYVQVLVEMPEVRNYSLYFISSDSQHVGPDRSTYMLIGITICRKKGERWKILSIASEPLRWLHNALRVCQLCRKRIGKRDFVSLMDKDPRGPLETYHLPWNRMLPRRNKIYLCHKDCFDRGLWYHAVEVMNG